jgi:hypothetical protein
VSRIAIVGTCEASAGDKNWPENIIENDNIGVATATLNLLYFMTPPKDWPNA